jgi:hypothetical protein
MKLARDLDEIVARTRFLRHMIKQWPEEFRDRCHAQFSGIAPDSALGMNDEQVHHVDSVCDGLLGGGGSRAPQVRSAALVTVCAKAWGRR